MQTACDAFKAEEHVCKILVLGRNSISFAISLGYQRLEFRTGVPLKIGVSGDEAENFTLFDDGIVRFDFTIFGVIHRKAALSLLEVH
jgi:hypothetical protein